MALIRTGRRVLWQSASASLVPTASPDHVWFTAGNIGGTATGSTFTRDGTNVIQSAWHKIDVRNADFLKIVWAGSVLTNTNVTAVTASSMRAAAIGVSLAETGSDFDTTTANWALPPAVATCQAAATPAATLAMSGQSLHLLLQSNGDLDIAGAWNRGQFDNSMFNGGGSVLTQACTLQYLAAGITPAVGHRTAWEIRVGQPNTCSTTAPSGTFNNDPLRVSGLQTVWFCAKSVNSYTLGATPALTIAGTLVALTYKEVFPLDPRSMRGTPVDAGW